MEVAPGLIAYLCWFCILAVAIAVAVTGKRATGRLLGLVGALLCWAIISAIIGYYEFSGIDYLFSTEGVVSLCIGALGLVLFAIGMTLAFRTNGSS